MSEYVQYKCMCCNRIVQGDVDENPLVISSVYSGLVFRSTGNFGSTIFDPIGETEEILQVVICDDCMKKKARRVTRLHNIKHEMTADRGEFTP